MNERFVMRKLLSITTISVACLLWGACSDEDSKNACPEGGLGVTSSTGTKCNTLLDPKDPELLNCQEQMESYKDYDCKEPQICFDTNVRQARGFVVSVSATAYGMSFILTNCSTSNQKLMIEKVEVLGNDRCYFAFDMGMDVQKLELAPGEDGLIQARYHPKQLGEDHAILRVHTNAQNYPQLDLYVCGTGIPRFPPGMDAGSPPTPDAGPVTEAGAAAWFCKNVKTPASCP